MTLRFGTDGMRGEANTELTPELVVALGRAAAQVLVADGSGRARFAIGRDTRLSGPMLQAALTAGVTSEGVEVVDLGVIPTPGVAHVSATEGIPAAVISASHNPFADNGIKLFAVGGRKLSDAVEEDLEARLDDLLHNMSSRDAGGARPPATGAGVGAVAGGAHLIERYADHLLGALEGRSLDGAHVVLDCAHGAATPLAAEVFRRAGAQVDVLHDRPDGTNINAASGSTHPQILQREVVAQGAHAGLAFDGDADRVLAVDGNGNLVDGDQVIGLCAIDLQERGRLAGGTVVVTVMSNLGLRRSMADAGIAVHETQVGDRYVLEALENGGWSLGGEQSGHVIFRDLASTGDGMLTGLVLLDLVNRRGEALSDLASAVLRRYPQVLRNVRVRDRGVLDGATDVWDAVRTEEAALGEDGRVLLRASGTEPLVRVMVEAISEEQADAVAARLCAVVEHCLA